MPGRYHTLGAGGWRRRHRLLRFWGFGLGSGWGPTEQLGQMSLTLPTVTPTQDKQLPKILQDSDKTPQPLKTQSLYLDQGVFTEWVITPHSTGSYDTPLDVNRPKRPKRSQIALIARSGTAERAQTGRSGLFVRFVGSEAQI